MTKEWTIDRLLLHPDLALEELNKAALSAAEPVAYRHTLYMELSQTDIEVNTSEKHPFGRPGVDYSPEYRITTEPLYAAPPAPSVAVKALRTAIHNGLIDGARLESDLQSEFDRTVDSILASVSAALSATPAKD